MPVIEPTGIYDSFLQGESHQNLMWVSAKFNYLCRRVLHFIHGSKSDVISNYLDVTTCSFVVNAYNERTSEQAVRQKMASQVT